MSTKDMGKAEGCAWIALITFAAMCAFVGLCWFIGWGIRLVAVIAGLV